MVGCGGGGGPTPFIFPGFPIGVQGFLPLFHLFPFLDLRSQNKIIFSICGFYVICYVAVKKYGTLLITKHLSSMNQNGKDG